MPWDKLADQAPALVALVLLVLMGGTLFWKQTKHFLQVLTGVSNECHKSHQAMREQTDERWATVLEKVDERWAGVLDRNTESLIEHRKAVTDMRLVLAEVKVTLERANGKP